MRPDGENTDVMAVVQGLLTALFRFAGKILNTAIGWATVMLFGRVTERRQTYLSLAAFGSLLWMISLLGVVFPGVGLWLLTFVRVPPGVDQDWIRLGMFAAIVVLPLLVGAVLLVILDQGRGPRQGTLARTLLRGYPYTLGLALTLAIMIVFAPLARLRHLARRWATVHVPIIIEDDDYLGVVQDIQHALGAAGIRTDTRPAPAVLRFSLRALAALSGRRARSRAADALAVLLAPDAEILVHPADLVIGAAPRAAARLRATLALRLTYTKAHLTYSQEAHEVEDELRTLWEAAGDHTVHREDLAVLRAIEARVGVLEIDFEEWEILQRQILLLDRHLRAEIDPIAADEREPVIRQAMSTLGRTLARAAVQTVRTLVNDGRGVAVMSRVSAVFEHQNDADRAINWLREQGVPDGQIRAITRDRRAEEMPTDREPPGETVLEVTLDGTRLTTQQLEAGLRRLNAKIGAV